jgi:hypothetical protein
MCVNAMLWDLVLALFYLQNLIGNYLGKRSLKYKFIER